jgi:hypothetical protein
MSGQTIGSRDEILAAVLITVVVVVYRGGTEFGVMDPGPTKRCPERGSSTSSNMPTFTTAVMPWRQSLYSLTGIMTQVSGFRSCLSHVCIELTITLPASLS